MRSPATTPWAKTLSMGTPGAIRHLRITDQNAIRPSRVPVLHFLRYVESLVIWIVRSAVCSATGIFRLRGDRFLDRIFPIDGPRQINLLIRSHTQARAPWRT